jgi:hypothetical protein
MFSDDDYYEEFEAEYDYESDIDAQEDFQEFEREMEEQKYVAERGAFERVGVVRPGQVFKGRILGTSLEELNNTLFRLNLNDEEKFSLFLNAAFNNVKETLDLNDRDLVILLELIPKIPYLMYKNPTAYVLGYYTLKNNVINKDKVNKVFKVLNKFESITEPDVIRYARFVEKII